MTLIDRDELIARLSANCVKRPCSKCNILCSEYMRIMGQQTVEIKQEGEKEMNYDYTTLKIEFKDGGERTYKNNWEDWDLVTGLVVVKDKDGKWIGAYNIDSVKSVEMW